MERPSRRAVSEKPVFPTDPLFILNLDCSEQKEAGRRSKRKATKLMLFTLGRRS